MGDRASPTTAANSVSFAVVSLSDASRSDVSTEPRWRRDFGKSDGDGREHAAAVFSATDWRCPFLQAGYVFVAALLGKWLQRGTRD